MTFEEMAYRERELFAIINKTRSAELDQVTDMANKSLRRDDFGQQKSRLDQVVSFKANKSTNFDTFRGKLGGATSAGKGMFGKPSGQTKANRKTIENEAGRKDIIEEASTWSSQGFEDVVSKPSTTEKQGLLPALPSLRSKANGRHARKFSNANQAVSSRA